MSGSRHIERFAPSPTGHLHLGHAFSALTAHNRARAAGGRFLLRIEDLDTARCRPEYVDGILEDLTWLGLSWDEHLVFQSDRQVAYSHALDRLAEAGLSYSCTCTRRDIADAVTAPQEGDPMTGLDGLVYPGTCRGKGMDSNPDRSIRLNLPAAIAFLGGPSALAKLTYEETGLAPGPVRLDPDHLLQGTGDIVLRRRDGAYAYHLAVVVDDAAQGVTHVTRGADLADAAPIQRLLQAILGDSPVSYHHHRLIRDDAGKRLAKRHDALSIATLRDQGLTPRDVCQKARASQA